MLGAVADFGALGLASGAIFCRRLDELTDSFQRQLKEQADECNKREAEVRDRYDSVVRKYDEERLQWTIRLDGLEKESKDIEALIKEGLGEMRQHYSKINARMGQEI